MSDVRIKYTVVKGSSSDHCCFQYSVLDVDRVGDVVCETWSQEKAERIADALNEYEAATVRATNEATTSAMKE